MRLHAARVLLALVGALAGGACAAAVRPSELAIVRAAVAAEDAEPAIAEPAIERALDRIVQRVGHGPPTMRRARRLHRVIQGGFLAHYRADADGLAGLVLGGDFNCLSASLLYGLAGRRLGYEVTVLERPGHLRVRLGAGPRAVEVETTLRSGFGPARSTAALPATDTDSEAAPPPTSSAAQPDVEYRELPLESALGFAWLNRAWRELGSGRTLGAAEHALRAAEFLPPDDPAAAGLRRLFPRAFREEYEQGRFDDAYGIAAIEARLFPELTTARDRLVAVADKRIADACDAGEPARADAILREVVTLVARSREAERLARGTLPRIAAAAVRVGDAALARDAAERYARSEPDAVEAERLRAWVESRAGPPAVDEPGICR